MLGATRIAPRCVLVYASKQPQKQQRRLAFINSLTEGLPGSPSVFYCQQVFAEVVVGQAILAGPRHRIILVFALHRGEDQKEAKSWKQPIYCICRQPIIGRLSGRCSGDS